MRRFLIVFLILAGFGTLQGFAQFNEYFLDKTLRFDYSHAGDKENEYFYFEELIEEPFWGGSKINLIDTFEYGNFYVKIFNKADNKLLYSRGYSSLFREWQTTNEAKKINRSMSETVVFPFPKKPVDVVLYSRNWDGVFEEVMRQTVDPNDYFIKKDRRHIYPTFYVHSSGDPANKVDIVILPDGYSHNEMGLFIEDCKNFAEELFRYAPYSDNRDKFNIIGILAPSEDSGNDIPAQNVWKQNLMNTSFYTFDSERYCMSTDNKSVRDLAANAPYDQIYILVNNEKYGGGAIYNYYNVSVNSNGQAGKIFIHELGHGFAGLGDEYYTSSTSYNDFYNLKVEPWEPNLTTLVDFDSKWKSMLKKRIPVPTPDTEKYRDKLGVFEGGGYVAKGVYRPVHDCLMNSFAGDEFCPVCSKAIQDMINFYCD